METFKEIIAKTHAKIIAILEKARSKLKKVTLKAELLIQTLKSKGGTFKKCSEKIENELNQIKNETDTNLNKCGDYYYENIKKYEDEIKKNITKIENGINDLRLEIVACFHLNPLKTVKCLLDKVS